MAEMHIESINAVTLAVHDMRRSVRFYTTQGFSIRYGGEHAAFTSLHAGCCYLNLIAQPAERRWSRWGRVIFHVTDVDTFHRLALEHGLAPTTTPGDATWGERYFHISDPDGHELKRRATARPQPRHLESQRSDSFVAAVNYDYSEEELKEIGGQVQKIARKVETTHVLFNNNYEDQGQRRLVP